MDGMVLENLDQLTKVVFAMKARLTDDDRDSTVWIEWNQGDPQDIVKINDPETGCISVLLDSQTLAISPGKYYFALQVEWSPSNRLEFKYGDGIVLVEQDIVRS